MKGVSRVSVKLDSTVMVNVRLITRVYVRVNVRVKMRLNIKVFTTVNMRLQLRVNAWLTLPHWAGGKMPRNEAAGGQKTISCIQTLQVSTEP